MSDELETQDQNTKINDPKGDPKPAATDPVSVTETPEYKGVIRDLQGERASRQQLEAQVAELNNRLSQLDQPKPANTGDELEAMLNEMNVDPEGYIQYRDVSKLVDRLVSKKVDTHLDQFNQEQQTRSRQQQVAMVNESMDTARREFTADKYGVDYDTVINDGLKPLLQKNPKLLEAIENDANPGQMAWRLGIANPAIAKKLEDHKSAKLVNQLNQGSPKRSAATQLVEQADEQAKSFEELVQLDSSQLEEMCRQAG
jgi:hypothetical protein